MFGLGSLVLHLAANTAEFSSDLGKAAHEADKRMKSIVDAAEKAGQLVGAAFVAAAGTMAVLVKQSINNADAMSKLSQGAGLATEAFSEIAYAAGLAGVSTEQFATSVTRLNRNIFDTAANTGEAREAFNALGIEVKNADGSLKNADAIMAEVADKFAGMEDGAGKSALAVMLFGRAGAVMIPMLNQGADDMRRLRDEARALGATIDTETGRAAEQFNDNLTRLNTAKQGLANTIMRTLLPQMNALTDSWVESAKKGEAFSAFAKGALVVFQTFAVLGANVAFVFRGIGTEIGGIAAQLSRLAMGDFAGFAAIGKSMKEEAARARAELDAFEAKMMGTADSVAAKAPETAKKLAAPMLGAADLSKKAAEEMRAAMMAAHEDAMGWVEAGVEAQKALEKAFAETLSRDDADLITQAPLLENATEQIFDIEKATKAATKRAESFNFTFDSALENIIVKGGDARNVVSALIADLSRMVTRELVTDPLGQFMKGALGNAGGISGIMGSIFGGSPSFGLSSAFEGMPAFAEGTDYVPRTGMALVHQGEKIIPAGENRRGDTFVFNISTPDAGSFRAARGQIGADMAGALSRARRNT